MTIKQLAAAWDRFFFTPQSPVPIGLFRILIGVLIIETIAVHSAPDWFLYYSKEALIPVHKYMASWWWFDPTVDFIPLLPGGDQIRLAYFVVLGVVAFFVAIGLFTRYTLPLCFLLLLSLTREFPLNQNGGDVMLHISLFLLCFGRSQDAFSVDNLIRAFREDWRKVGFKPIYSPPWIQRSLQLQLALAYLDTFLWKVTGPDWLNGTAVYYATRLPDFFKFTLPPFLDFPIVMKLMTWGTLLIEFALWSLIWFRDLRYFVLIAGLLLHFGIDYAINLPVFEAMFLSLYVLFIYPEDLTRFWDGVKARIVKRWGPAHRLSFDGECILCVRATGVLHRLDVFGRIRLVDFRDRANREILSDLDFERAQGEMLLDTGSGWIGGFRAFLKMSLWLPMLWPAAPFLRLPGIFHLGQFVYRLIARNRYILFGRCSDGVCSIHAQAPRKVAASSAETGERSGSP